MLLGIISQFVSFVKALSFLTTNYTDNWLPSQMRVYKKRSRRSDSAFEITYALTFLNSKEFY
jgi:hypothetical protein